MFSKLPTHDYHHHLFAELSAFGIAIPLDIDSFPFRNYYFGPHANLFYQAVMYELWETTSGDPHRVTIDMLRTACANPANQPTHGYMNLRNWMTGKPYVDLGDEDRLRNGRIV